MTAALHRIRPIRLLHPPFPQSEEDIDDLYDQWISYGHKPQDIQKKPDGLTVRISDDAVLEIETNGVSIHGRVTDDAIAAGIRYAQEAWDGRMLIFGREEFKLRCWAHAQVAGVVIGNYEPPSHLRREANDLVTEFSIQHFNLQFASGKTLGDPIDNRPWGYRSAEPSREEVERRQRIENAMGFGRRAQRKTI